MTKVEMGDTSEEPLAKLEDDREENNAELSSNATVAEEISISTGLTSLSKKQLKKQRKLAEYQRTRKERRLKERERQKQKRQEAIAKGLPARIGPSRKVLKKKQLAGEAPSAHIAVDLDYDDLMSDRDIAKCVKQCLRIYTTNRRSEKPCALSFTGLKRDGSIHKCFLRNDGWENWNVSFHFDKSHTEVYPIEQIVYLTCESDDVLECLEKDKIYVIGGLVDHNHQKGVCHGRAVNAGIRTARLPLSENVDMKTRSVLSTYHVFEILLRVAEGKSWVEAILGTIPIRKGAKPKLNSEEDSKNEQENN